MRLAWCVLLQVKHVQFPSASAADQRTYLLNHSSAFFFAFAWVNVLGFLGCLFSCLLALLSVLVLRFFGMVQDNGLYLFCQLPAFFFVAFVLWVIA